MNDTQQLLVNLLSAAIRNQPPPEIKEADWQLLFSSAIAHQIHTLLFPILSKLNPGTGPNDEIMREWQRSALSSGMNQLQHMQNIGDILKELNDADIPVIVLKGLVLRDLYPYPELRTMSDADMVIPGEHMEKAKNLLLRRGYLESNLDPKHIHLLHPVHLSIELHRWLLNQDYVKNAECLESSIWENASPIKIAGAQALRLSPEDEVLYLCLHMAVHLRHSGFGLRQLCDLVLLLESDRDKIDWDTFRCKVKECGFERFVSAILMVCRKLFHMLLPQSPMVPIDENDPFIDVLIHDILSGGAHGNSSADRQLTNSILNSSKDKRTGYLQSKVSYFTRLLFPAPKNLGPRYAYAKRHPLLLPMAWIHRMIHDICRKEARNYAKEALFNSSRHSFERRSGLMDWLGL